MGRRYLFIVSQGVTDLYEHVKRNFAGDREVEVLLDRRRGERRQRVEAYEPERRQADRRRPPGSHESLPSIGFGAAVPVLVVEDRTPSDIREI